MLDVNGRSGTTLHVGTAWSTPYRASSLESNERLDWRSIVTVGGEDTQNSSTASGSLAGIASSGFQRRMRHLFVGHMKPIWPDDALGVHKRIQPLLLRLVHVLHAGPSHHKARWPSLALAETSPHRLSCSCHCDKCQVRLDVMFHAPERSQLSSWGAAPSLEPKHAGAPLPKEATKHPGEHACFLRAGQEAGSCRASG